MPTLIYLPSSGAPDVTPSTWIFPNQINPVTYKAATTKAGTALTTKTEATGTTSPTTRAMVRWVIGPLAAQSISGTVRAVIRCSESNTGANATLAMAIKIIQPNGADRATLLGVTASDSATAPYEMNTVLDSRRVWTANETEPLSLTTQSASAGDYLVIEMGFRSATTTTRNVSLRLGDASASNLAYGDGETNDYNGWVEFSGDLQILTPITATLNKMLDGIGLEAAGTLTVTGAISKILDEITLAAVGATAVTTNLEKTLDGIGLASQVGALASAALSKALDDIGLAAYTQVSASEITAALSKTLDAATLSGSIQATVAGSLSRTLDGLGLSSQSSIAVTAALGRALDNATLSSAVNVSGAVEASLDKQLGGLALQSAAAIRVTGSLTRTLDAATLRAAYIAPIVVMAALSIILQDAGAAPTVQPPKPMMRSRTARRTARTLIVDILTSRRRW